MIGTSGRQVKGTDGMAHVMLRKVDIERRGVQGLMSHERFDRQKIRTTFIKMRTEGMAKGRKASNLREGSWVSSQG